MNKESTISLIKHECNDFANKLMSMFKNVRVEFSVYDEEELYNDTKKGK